MSNKTSPGLGKGFAVLMPDGIDPSLLEDDKSRIQNLFISDLEANPDQPREHFDELSLNELAESIKAVGVLQPLIVTPTKQANKYRIIAGERRWRSAEIAGLNKVPVIVRDAVELEELEISLIENIQRVDLDPIEQAVSIHRLREQFSIPIEDIAARLGKAPSTITNIHRLLQLPEDARQALHESRITEGHARSILSLKDDPAKQTELLETIQAKGWSVRQAEQFVVALKDKRLSQAKKHTRTETETPQTIRLSQKLKTEINVLRMAKGGRLVIRFKTDGDLNRLYRLLNS